MAEKRKADMLLGKNSLADALRARREAVESGDIANAAEAFAKTMRPDQPQGATISYKPIKRK